MNRKMFLSNIRKVILKVKEPGCLGVAEQAVTETVQHRPHNPCTCGRKNQEIDESSTRRLYNACIPEFTSSFFLIVTVVIINENNKMWRRRQTLIKQLYNIKAY